MPNLSTDLIDAIAVTAEICGTQLSGPAAKQFAQDLSEYPGPQILGALKRCRSELKGRLTIAEVLSRIDDGRPGPDAAFAALVWEDGPTAILTQEMAYAQGQVFHQYQAGDKHGARQAFREIYLSVCRDARENGVPVKWFLSLGWDGGGRMAAAKEAIASGKMDAIEAARFVPQIAEEKMDRLPLPESARKMIAEIGKGMLVK